MRMSGLSLLGALLLCGVLLSSWQGAMFERGKVEE